MATRKKVTKKKAAKKKSKKKTAKKRVAKKSPGRKKRAQKKTKVNPKGAGAQQFVIDWDTVDKLCLIQCTGEEIASVLNMDYDTLQTACKREQKIKFSDYIGQKKEGGKASLRRKQWKLVEDGNPTMCIWLGKQYLKQTEKQEITGKDGKPVSVGIYLPSNGREQEEPES